MLPGALKHKLAATRSESAGVAATKEPLKPHNKRKHVDMSNDANDAAAATTRPPKQKPKAKPQHHKRPLTTDEINRLQEAAANQLTNENLYQLQIDELLQASQIPSKHERFVTNEWLPAFNEFLAGLPSDAAKTGSGDLPPKTIAGCPFDADLLHVPAHQFQFVAPRAPAVLIGSLATATMVGPRADVDVCVEMPAQCFQKDNYMNLVYHRKRALYVYRLAVAMAKWRRATEPEDVRLAFFGGDRLRPVLRVQNLRRSGGAAGGSLRQLRINIHVVGESNAFKLSRFQPATSNVRSVLFGDEEEGDADGDHCRSTPHYNAGILRDLTLQQNEQFVQRMLLPDAQRPVREALRLFKLWLRTRGLDGSGGGGTFVWAAFAVLLIKQRRVHVTQSAYDVLRQMWMCLATSRWHESASVGVGVGQKSTGCGGASLAPQATTALDVFHEHYDVVFVDVTGHLNLCAQLPLDVYLRLREESGRALTFLSSEATVVTFRHLFADRRPSYQQYDHVISINADVDLQPIVGSEVHRDQFYDHCGQVAVIARRLIAGVLRQGFGKRIDSMTPLYDDDASGDASGGWRLGERCARAAQRIAFGIVLNAEFCTDVLDKGPQADQQPAADDFKRFWGQRSEMRRFQDGSIVEACVWASPTAPLAERRLTCKRIAVHLLEHHFGIEPQQVLYVADQLDVVYQVDPAKLLANGNDDDADDRSTLAAAEIGPLNSEHLALSVVKSFDELGRQLRSLDGLPLSVTDVTGASPVFRYCEIEPIMARAAVEEAAVSNGDGSGNRSTIYQSYAVLEAVCELSASGRWPDSLEALLRLKAAFLLRIAAGLCDQHQLDARTEGHWLDVIKDGYHFRLRISLAKELMLLKRTRVGGTDGDASAAAAGHVAATAYRSNAASRTYERDMLRLPRLTVLLHTLYHQHSSFGPAVLLAKRWLRAQLLDATLWPDECVELLMASVYRAADSWPVPAQPQAAFVRWLQRMAFSDWNTEMVLLNFGDQLTGDQVGRLEQRFANNRSAFPALCIVTPAATQTLSTVMSSAPTDATTSVADWTVWSDEAPSRQVVVRAATLAAHALTIVESSIGGQQRRPFDTQLLFVPSLEGYDVLIRLRRGRVQQTALYGFVQTRRGRQPDRTAPAADFNVARMYLDELRTAYDEFAVFFYDPCGGETIAVMWKPAVRVVREFSTSGVMGCREQQQEDDNGEPTKYVCNLEQIVEDFRMIGHGLVETVNVLSSID